MRRCRLRSGEANPAAVARPSSPLLYRCTMQPVLPLLRSYAQSKLANVLFTRELARRLREEGGVLEAFCLHPG